MNDNELQGMSQILRHRLRGIAAGIRGALGLIEEEGASRLPPELLEYFPLMSRECDALQEVANRLTLYFDEPPPTEPTSADVVTLRAVGALSGSYPTVDVRTKGGCGERVNGWMELALKELLVNACEAAPNGSVEIRLRADKGSAIWTVSDYGPGGGSGGAADPFVPFRTTKPRHLGLGLPIARKLSERAGGWCDLSGDRRGDAAWSIDLCCPILNLL
jgi:signal transduction histidine kinase